MPLLFLFLASHLTTPASRNRYRKRYERLELGVFLDGSALLCLYHSEVFQQADIMSDG